MSGHNTGILSGCKRRNCFDRDKKGAPDNGRGAPEESADRIVIGPTFVLWRGARMLPQAHIR
jgi:hypothetical protein